MPNYTQDITSDGWLLGTRKDKWNTSLTYRLRHCYLCRTECLVNYRHICYNLPLLRTN